MVELHLLGPPRLVTPEHDRVAEQLLTRPKRVALLAYLALDWSRTGRSRDTLLALFWPESDTPRARHSLNQELYGLRRALGRGMVQTGGGGNGAVHVDNRQLWCDVTAFENALRAGRRAEALERYRAPFLDGFHLGGCPEFEHWLEEERARLHRRAVGGALDLARELEAGDVSGAVDWLRRATLWDPYDETVLRALLSLLHRTGERSAALAEYARFRARLRQDLEADPSTDTERLAAAIRDDSHQRSDSSPPSELPVPRPRVEPGSEPDRVPALPRPRGMRWGRIGAAILGLSGLLTAGLIAFARGEEPLPAGSVARVVILPFEVAGRGEVAHLADGLPLLLGVKLDDAGPISVVDPRAVLRHAERERGGPGARGIREVRAVAERFRANLVITGSIIQVESLLVLRATIRDPEGHPLHQVVADAGPERHLAGSVDQLARMLVATRYADAAGRLANLAALTTSSLPALKAYLAGERAFRQGRFAEASEAFERAARLDTTFALAHYRLSLAMLWADIPDTLPFDADARALRHASRLGEHHRLLLEAFAAWRRGAADAAESGYRNVVARYPEDVEAWHQLGETLFHYNPLRGRAVAEAREAFERATRIDPTNWSALWHLALLAAAEHRREDLRTLLAQLAATRPDPPRALQIRTIKAFAFGTEEDQTRVLREIDGAHAVDAWAILWRVAVQLGDLEGARTIARSLTQPDRLPLARSLGYENLAYLELAAGRTEAAAEAIAAFARVDPWGGRTLDLRTFAATLPFLPPRTTELERLRTDLRRWHPAAVSETPRRGHLLGLASAALGDTVAVLHEAATLEAFAPASESHDLLLAQARGLRARVARLGGRPTEALALLEEGSVARWFGWTATSPFQSSALDRFLRAELLAELGRTEEALRWYASFGEHSVSDLVFLAPARKRMTAIRER